MLIIYKLIVSLNVKKILRVKKNIFSHYLEINYVPLLLFCESLLVINYRV